MSATLGVVGVKNILIPFQYPSLYTFVKLWLPVACILLGFNVFHAFTPILVQLFYFLESAIERHHD